MKEKKDTEFNLKYMEKWCEAKDRRGMRARCISYV